MQDSILQYRQYEDLRQYITVKTVQAVSYSTESMLQHRRYTKVQSILQYRLF